jgi:stage V sporulation protein G
LDNCFAIRAAKIIRGPKGYFVAMPRRKRADGTYSEIVSPITPEARRIVEERVLAEYEKITGEPVKRRVLK